MQAQAIPQEIQTGRASPLPRARNGIAPLWVDRAQEALALLGVFGLAFGLRTVFLGIRPESMTGTFSLDAARKMLSDGAAFVQSRSPADYGPVGAAAIELLRAATAPSRQLSFYAGMAAVLLTWRLGRRLFSAPVGLLAAGLLAVSPFQVIASNDVRMDPPLECLVLVSTLILWRAVAWPNSLWFWGAYGAGVALMARTSPYTLLLLPAHAAWVFARLRFGEALEHLCLAGAAAAALYFAGNSYGVVFSDPTVLFSQTARFDAVLPVVATQAFGGYPFNGGNPGAAGAQLTYLVLLLLPFFGSMAAGAVALGRINRWALLLVGLSWTIPVVLIALASPILGQDIYARPILFIQPFAAVFVAAGVLWLRRGFTAALKADRPPAAAVRS